VSACTANDDEHMSGNDKYNGNTVEVAAENGKTYIP
jgi:hypothetical protein